MDGERGIGQGKKDFLVSGVTDWVMLVEAESLARYYTGSDDWRVRRDFSMEFLADLMRDGLIIPGDFTDDRGFRPWGLRTRRRSPVSGTKGHRPAPDSTWATSAGST